MRVEDFSEGDCVQHLHMSTEREPGIVEAIKDDGIHVRYSRLTKPGCEWHGIYDQLWLDLHPGWLVKV